MNLPIIFLGFFKFDYQYIFLFAALIQLIAATMAKRDVCYLTFDDTTLRDELYDIHEYLTKANGGMGIGE